MAEVIGVEIFLLQLHSYSKKFDSCSGSCFSKNVELQLLFDSYWEAVKLIKIIVTLIEWNIN